MAGLLGVLVLAALSVQRVAHLDGPRWGAAATAALFGCWVIYFWQVGVVLFDVPRVLLPAPSFILRSLIERWDTLLGDFVQTVLKAVLVGWVLRGCTGPLYCVYHARVLWRKNV